LGDIPEFVSVVLYTIRLLPRILGVKTVNRAAKYPDLARRLLVFRLFSWYPELVFKTFSWFLSLSILVTIDSRLLDHCDKKTEKKENYAGIS
jgi:hypothetical protein